MNRTISAPRWGAGAGALALALSALAMLGLAARADAAFSLGKCAGSPILGRGASFARDAHQKVFIPRFQGSYCFGSSASVTYDAAGSGAGRASVKVRNDTPRFGMSDEPPIPLEVEQMNVGGTVTGGVFTADSNPSNDGHIHVVPAAVGTVAPLVNFPDGCDPKLISDPEYRTITAAEITGDASKEALLRVRFPKTVFEKMWAGEAGFKQWDDVVPGLAGHAACEKPIIRVVRFDESGTSFAFKDELNAINGGRNWLTDFSFVSPGLTRNWPNAAAFGPREDCPEVGGVFPSGPGADSTEASSAGPDQLTSGCANGNGALVTKLTNTDGSIGYSDVSTARTASPSLAVNPASGTTPDKYWTQMQDGTTPTPLWQEPTQDANGYRTDGVTGANCSHATFHNVPANTFGDWSKTSGVNSPGAYAICTMTYGLVFDDNADVWGSSAQEEAKARTVKDYWENALSDASQALLSSKDYSELPAAILTISRAGIAEVGWEKGEGTGVDDEGKGGTGGSGGGSTGSSPAPLPLKPSNLFSLPRKSISSKTGGATVSVKLPGAGKLVMVGTAKVQIAQKRKNKRRQRKSKTIKVGQVVLNASRAGTYDLTLKPSGAAKKELSKKGSLRVSLQLTFTPTGGEAKTTTTGLTLKLSKKKKKKGGRS
jgi:ABC-type phosphate transport system substrate-binding protein